MIAIIIGIDHGYYAIKTRQVSFPSGIIGYDYEPYTMQNVLQYQGKYYVCGTGRQTLVKNKTSNDNYYLLTLAAIAEEIKHRKAERKTEVILAVGLPLSSLEERNRDSGSICCGKSSQCDFYMKVSYMR